MSSWKEDVRRNSGTRTKEEKENLYKGIFWCTVVLLFALGIGFAGKSSDGSPECTDTKFITC